MELILFNYIAKIDGATPLLNAHHHKQE